MAAADDHEILQDFLLEAGEILELLSQQLIQLEQRPHDSALLHAIFRGFHTIKGGAGFLQLSAMVECCHVTENLFDILRNGKLQVSAELTDVVLQTLDTLNRQFDQLCRRQPVQPAAPELLAALATMVAGGTGAASDTAVAPKAPVSSSSTLESTPQSTLGSGQGEGDITDAEFEELLDALSTDEPAAAATEPGNSSTAAAGHIRNDEFESLLDQLHGNDTAKDETAARQERSVNGPEPQHCSGEDLSDAEFEQLLDQLHGKGRAPGAASASDSAAEQCASSASAQLRRDDDGISEQEFEQLLDQLHGEGQGPGRDVAAASYSEKTFSQRWPSGSELRPPPAAEATWEQPSAGAAVAAGTGVAAVRGADGQLATVAETSVRVDTQRLDDIMNMVGELVLVRNRLLRLGLDVEDEGLCEAVGQLDVVTADLQSSVMKTRMQPIGKAFNRFPRLVRDLARNLEKEITLELRGEDTDLDKNLVQALADPLLHLVRNSVDHGIELPAQREANGKPRLGRIVLAAHQEGDRILLSIRDDGAGMDPARLRDIAIAKGIIDAAAADRLSEAESFALIFAPGFSTRTQVSDVSGRGVGMDVVRTRIAQLNGSIEVSSVPGEGTCISIKVPLTLAIMPTLMIMLGQQTFALPLVSVNEIILMDLSRTHLVDGQECVTLRDRAIPIFHLRRWLLKGGADSPAPPQAHVVIVSAGTRQVGFVVDQLVGQEEVVIKPLGRMLQGTPGMAGATITGDGRIALILDVPGMLKRYAGHG